MSGGPISMLDFTDLDVPSRVYLIGATLVIVYMIFMLSWGYGNLSYTLEYARQLQNSCGSQAMEQDTARYTIQQHVQSTPIFTDNSYITMNYAFTGLTLFSALLTTLLSMKFGIFNYRIVMYFNIVYIVLSVLFIVMIKNLSDVYSLSNTYKSYINTLITGNGVFVDILVSWASSESDPQTQTPMTTLVDKVVARKAHSENYASYDDAKKDIKVKTTGKTTTTSDPAQIIKYTKFDNTSTQNITPDAITAQKAYTSWKKYLADSSNMWKSVKNVNDKTTNIKGFDGKIQKGTYALMAKYIGTLIEANDALKSINDITIALLKNMSPLNGRNDFALMYASASEDQSQMQALNFLTDLNAGNPTDDMYVTIYPMLYVGYFMTILAAYIVYHVTLGNSESSTLYITLGLILTLILVSIVKMYSLYKDTQ
jgi:hypothetical protein